MADRAGPFAGDDPFAIARDWLAAAEATEPNDPSAMALATVGPDGLPNVRMVLLKAIEADAFVFYTNYESVKAGELDATGKAALVLHWKSLRRQIRARGTVAREAGPQADAYYRSRSLPSRLGAWASRQSRPLASRAALMAEVAKVTLSQLVKLRAVDWNSFVDPIRQTPHAYDSFDKLSVCAGIRTYNSPFSTLS
jgi:pyridoxamine 5'-phosphate oxidase